VSDARTRLRAVADMMDEIADLFAAARTPEQRAEVVAMARRVAAQARARAGDGEP
jgi:hypothetical protein